MCEVTEERRLSVVAPEDEDIFLVYAPGSQVALLPGNEYLSARVLAVQVRENGHVLYHLAYWAGNGRTEEWVPEAEVHAVDEPVKMAIGFESKGEKPRW